MKENLKLGNQTTEVKTLRLRTGTKKTTYPPKHADQTTLLKALLRQHIALRLEQSIGHIRIALFFLTEARHGAMAKHDPHIIAQRKQIVAVGMNQVVMIAAGIDHCRAARKDMSSYKQ
jgi:hypothetical protein